MKDAPAYDPLTRQNQRLSILYDIALTVGQSLDLEEILREALRKIISFMEADAGVIYVIDEETLEMIPVAFTNLSKNVVEDLSVNKVKVGECMCGTIAETDCEVIIPEKASSDQRFTRPTLHEEGMEFYAGLPLKAQGNVVGVLCVITHVPYKTDPELLDILRAVTVPLGLAIDNAQLFDGLRKTAAMQARYCNFSGIIASSSRMKAVLDLVRKVMDAPASILIYGESGTGKELIARAIHYNSNRRDKPFVAVNCAAVPEELLESEFFGYKKGAFTGAHREKKGLFEAAVGGSLFLDEIEAMSPRLQAKLLRVLQDGTFFKVGDTQAIEVDVRVIAATNRSLEDAVQRGRFREDLYYRLNVIRIDLPPLRHRPEDIPLLARYFMRRIAGKMNRKNLRMDERVMNLLVKFPWPGNVRQLENAIERAVTVSGSDELQVRDLPHELAATDPGLQTDWGLETIEHEHIQKVLNITDGNKKKASELLGIDQSTLWRKLKKITPPS